jgi:anaerobic glycerol-3-phosphate dehydrogenase
MASDKIHVDILVIGGGIAGMRASLDLAARGYPGALVEMKRRITRIMIGLSKVFPTLDCSRCITINDMDRFHLGIDTIDRLPQTGDEGIYLKQRLKNTLIEHKQYIDKYGQELPEICHWKLGATNAGKTV